MPIALAALTSAASAQAGGCADIQQHIEERKALVARLQALGSNKKKPAHPREACALFNKLAANGATTLKWIEANKDWCSIPDSFAEGMKNDHGRATSMKTQACNVAAKHAAMERQARQAQQQQQQQRGGGLLGGPGLSGEYKIPQGAL